MNFRPQSVTALHRSALASTENQRGGWGIVSWLLAFQETMERPLTQNVAKIVKSIEDSVEVMRKEIIEAERRAEIQHRKWEEQRAR